MRALLTLLLSLPLSLPPLSLSLSLSLSLIKVVIVEERRSATDTSVATFFSTMCHKLRNDNLFARLQGTEERAF